MVEALSCGVPAIVGSNSSLTELVQNPEAWFDASDADDIARVLARALGDSQFMTTLRRENVRQDFRWEMVAENTFASYEAARGNRRLVRPRIALVSPMPPEPSGVADYSAHLLRGLSELARVDVFTSTDAEPTPLKNVRWFKYQDIDTAMILQGSYDRIVTAMGNSEFHLDCFEVLRRYGGDVIAHDVRFTGLLWAAARDGRDWNITGASEVLDDLSEGKLPDSFRHFQGMDAQAFFRLNKLMIEPIARYSDRIYVHSHTARTLAELNLPPEDRRKIQVLPFGIYHREVAPQDGRDTIASFGVVDRLKRSEVVLEVFIGLATQLPQYRFALIGQCFDPDLWDDLQARLSSTDLADRITLSGRVDRDTYDGWLSRSLLALQLRSHSNGETSAAVADCLAAGVPVVVSQTGSMAEYGDVCMSTRPDATVAELDEIVSSLIDDTETRLAMVGRGLHYAHEHNFVTVSKELLRGLVHP